MVQRDNPLNGSRFDGKAGLDVFVSGIGPVDGELGPTVETSYYAARRTCMFVPLYGACNLLLYGSLMRPRSQSQLALH